MVGNPQTIQCRVGTVPGVSTVLIDWTGPEGAIMNDSRISISNTSNGSIFTSYLQFEYLMEQDGGSYTCNVMILGNNTSESVDMQPTGKTLVLITTYNCSYVDI